MADYYELLGVSKGATDAEIKSAYRKKALEWHPDRNKAPEAAEKFKEINKAYEVLADPQKKQMYDQYGEAAFRGGAGNPGGAYGGQQGPFSYTYSWGGEGSPFGNSDFTDPFEIFEQFFGFGGVGGRRTQRRDAYSISLTFQEAVHGVEKETVIKGHQKKIKIPAGVDDGTRIRFSDFDLIVSVKPDAQFKRQGQDVIIEHQISYAKAVLGGVEEVPTLKGRVKLKVKAGTQAGTTVRLRGEGIVYPNTKRHGDEYVVYRIKVPARVSSKAKKMLQELQDELG